MENAWSYQLKNGRIGTKKHIILHTLKTGRDGPVMSPTRTLDESSPSVRLLPACRSFDRGSETRELFSQRSSISASAICRNQEDRVECLFGRSFLDSKCRLRTVAKGFLTPNLFTFIARVWIVKCCEQNKVLGFLRRCPPPFLSRSGETCFAATPNQ